MAYLLEERETHISTCDETKTWKIETLQSKVVNKLKRVGIEPDRIVENENGNQYFYENIPYNQISFRAKTFGNRVMSDEHKQKLKDAREARLNK
ncbi:hypothetical protein BK127_02720 [Paenibacillus sp. FSL H7-0331]|nr:hypothetical protein BK127_02720 [Paenibacillus sp. FSL H7-0331]